MVAVRSLVANTDEISGLACRTRFTHDWDVLHALLLCFPLITNFCGAANNSVQEIGISRPSVVLAVRPKPFNAHILKLLEEWPQSVLRITEKQGATDAYETPAQSFQPGLFKDRRGIAGVEVVSVVFADG